MATQADVRKIALGLPGVVQADTGFAFSVRVKGRAKGFAWVWMERVDPKKPRVPQPKVLALRVATLVEKQRLIDSDGDAFFTEPHYEGFPAVLVRLPAITARKLAPLIEAAWRSQASRDLQLTKKAGRSLAPTRPTRSTRPTRRT
jgi:hypothetical protein